MGPLKSLRRRRVEREVSASTRGVEDPEERQIIRENVEAGLPPEFRLPYPYPRNEHEDGMNMVAVMAAAGRPVMSGRSGL